MTNLGLKIFAILSAIILWVIVINVENPDQTLVIKDINIDKLNEKTLSDSNVAVLSFSNETVDITFRGKRLALESLKDENIKAVVNVSEYTNVGKGKFNKMPIKILNVPNEIDIQIESKSPEFVRVELDETVKEYIDIKYNFIGELDNDYIMAPSELKKNRVLVTMPKTKKEALEEIVVEIDVTGAEKDRERNISIDKDKYGILEMFIEESKIELPIYKYEEYDIEKYINTEEYEVTAKPSKVTIAGTKENIDKFKDDLKEIKEEDIEEVIKYTLKDLYEKNKLEEIKIIKKKVTE
ncbi:MAG: CdaR family protein [Clostridia bacterium]|jgi:hypothetical protein|nr:CdaR family protein [Clostridia bacterium]